MEVKAVFQADRITDLAKNDFKKRELLIIWKDGFWQKKFSGNVMKNIKMKKTVFV